MVAQRFTVQPEGNCYRVLDSTTAAFTRGRFHTAEQAEAWITGEVLRLAFVPQTSMHSRARAYLITDRNYYHSNEAVIEAHNNAPQ